MPLTEHMEVAAQQYCLRWKYHHSNLQVMFAQLLERESFCDVTLACEGRTLRAHKMMLSACSTYFDAIFSKHEEKDPIVILKDVKFDDIKALVEFMYKGEINVENSQLNTLLQTAEELRIKGLAAVSWRSEGEGAWRTVEPPSSSGGAAATTTTPSNNSLNQNQRGASHKYPQQSTRKRKMKADYSYAYSSNKKASVYGGSQQSADDYAGSLQSESGGDEDSQEGMWDTRSHEEVYSESEDIKPRVSNSNSNSLSVPVGEGDVIAQAENDEDDMESSDSPILSTNGNGSTNNGTSGTPCNNSVSNNVNNGSSGGNTPNTFQSTPQTTSTPSSTPVKQELMDVIKMTAYIQQGGRRPHFWETSSTKRVMEAIKNKEIEMKVAAELLGVSYGTLYGRYRDAYGCLKHPYRVREFWHEPPSVEVITKLQRKELSLFKAAEMLNVTVTTLANYLAALNREEIEEGDDDVDSVACAQQALSINPDITIVKKEKSDDPSTSVNGNK